jgi:hypothetical protein
MNGPIFQLAPYIAALLPFGQAALLAYLWWASLSRPWLFVVVGLVGLYALMAVFATFVFKGVGISGAPAGPKPFFDPLEVKIVVLIVAFVIFGALALWGLRLLLAKV